MIRSRIERFLPVLYAVPLILIFLVLLLYFYYTCSVSSCGDEWIIIAVPMLIIIFLTVIVSFKPDKVLALFRKNSEGGRT